MMAQNFKLYCQYYDLLYQDKKYGEETNYLVKLIHEYRPGSTDILELGSGTGTHANLLHECGFHVLGLERSPEMVDIANQKKHQQVRFEIANITDFSLNQTFDIALSLFHVISYLTANESLISTFKNVHQHLNKDGLFIFDVWHSEAVNFQIPEKRRKKLQNEHIEVIRNAEPVIYSNLNIVEVNYDIQVRDLKDNSTLFIKEKHPMRHFSKSELQQLAKDIGFELLHTEEFLSKAEPSIDTWGVCYILKKIN